MSSIAEAANKFVTPYNPSEGPRKWICVDDRPVLEPTLTLIPEPLQKPEYDLYLQTAGGAAGVGKDWAVAQEMAARRRRQHTTGISELVQKNYFSEAVQVMGGIAAKVVEAEDIELFAHEGCAGEGKLKEITQISRKIFAPKTREDYGTRAELLTRSREIYPDITDEQFEIIGEIDNELLKSERIIDADSAAAALEQGSAEWRKQHGSGLFLMKPVRRVPLVDSPHVSPYFLANHQRGTAFNTRAAFTDKVAPLPAYNVSMGDMPEIAMPLAELVPFKTTDFLAATAVRHAATSMALPVPEGHNSISIHRLAA